jgi:radical SAM modification target selenobiotic family peptide
MEKKELTKILAGLSIAGLLTGFSLTFTGCASTGKSA